MSRRDALVQSYRDHLQYLARGGSVAEARARAPLLDATPPPPLLQARPPSPADILATTKYTPSIAFQKPLIPPKTTLTQSPQKTTSS